MKNPCRCHIGRFLGLMLAIVALDADLLCARGELAPHAAEQPFATVFMSSLSRFHSVCEVIFKSVERPELFESMGRRLERYNDFAGFDREKPLGMMFTWGEDSTSFIVFLPVIDIDELLTTATFGAVGFHQVSPNHYQIERVVKPYQVLVRKDYAYIAESSQTIKTIRVTADQLTRRWRGRYDLVAQFDLRQIPRHYKQQCITTLRATIEPALQTGDQEAAEFGRLRKMVGSLLLDVVESSVFDTNRLTVGVRVAPENGHLHIDLEMEAAPKSSLANFCNKCSAGQSPFSPFLESHPETAAVAVFNVNSTGGLISKVLGKEQNPAVTDSRIDAVMCLVGERLGEFSFVGAISGPDVKTLNDLLPGLLTIANTTGLIELFEEGVDSFRDVLIHSVVPRNLDQAVKSCFGSSPEVILGQEADTLWYGMGSVTELLNDLKDAIEVADDAGSEQALVPIVQAQIKGRTLPELVATNPLIPNMDTRRVREELSKGADGVTLKLLPVRDGMKLTVEFEQGFVRLVGRDWVRQIESRQSQK